MSRYIETPCGIAEVPHFARERVETMSDNDIKEYLERKPRFIDPFIVAEAKKRGII